MRVVTSLAFFTPEEVESLAQSSGATKSSATIKRQAQVLGFLQALSSRIGFPQRTVATAQLLYLRFHLFYSPSEFVPHEVGIACLVVAAKVNDTPKKSRDVILSSWALRYPELVRSVPLAARMGDSSVITAKASPFASAAIPPSQSGLGVISESDIDSTVLDLERKRVLALEGMILQSIAFDFNVRTSDNLLFSVKLARTWNADKDLARLAWQVASDTHRTYAPLVYPASTIAAASVYAASLLSLRCTATLSNSNAAEIVQRFEQDSQADATATEDWEKELCCTVADVEDVVHSLLDLYGSAIAALPAAASASSTGITPISPATPASPSDSLSTDTMPFDARNPNAGRKLPSHVFSPPPFGILHWCSYGIQRSSADMLNELTQMKIALRKNEEKRGSGGNRTSKLPVRVFDRGGIRGDAEKEDDEDIEQSWQERSKNKQYAALQRFLF